MFLGLELDVESAVLLYGFDLYGNRLEALLFTYLCPLLGVVLTGLTVLASPKAMGTDTKIIGATVVVSTENGGKSWNTDTTATTTTTTTTAAATTTTILPSNTNLSVKALMQLLPSSSSSSYKIATGEGATIRELMSRCPTLRRPPTPPFWASSAWVQSLLLFLRIAEVRKDPNGDWEKELFKLPDGQDLLLSWMWPWMWQPHVDDQQEKEDDDNHNQDEQDVLGVVLISHTVCGSATDHFDLARRLCAEGFVVVGLNRRGHGVPLQVPRFNTTGCPHDLTAVLRHIRAKVPGVPIMAAGFSAGSSLVARYLGNEGHASLIDAAVLVSPGYDMEASFDALHAMADAYVTKLAKETWLLQNGNDALLKHSCPSAFEGLMAAKTMKEWHDHMWAIMGYTSKEEYFRDHNPAYKLQDIQKPILYINSLDDFMFPPQLITPWAERLTTSCAETAIVHTPLGGHCAFLDGGRTLTSWSDRVIVEFCIATAERLRKSREADAPQAQQQQQQQQRPPPPPPQPRPALAQ